MAVEIIPDTHILEVAQPCDFVASVDSGQSHRWERDGEWRWSVLSGRIITARPIRQSPGAAAIEYQAAPHGEPRELERDLSSYFRLDDDLEAIYADISRDPRVASMVDRYRGLRLLRVDPWECLISFICSANSNLARIHANVEAMAQSLGSSVSLNGKTRYILPEPDVLASAGETFLRGLGLGFRAPYVAYAAQAVASGQIDLELLKRMPYMEAKGQLMEMYGIGSKIADCVLLHSLEKVEAFPIDIWVRRALLDWYFPGQKPPPDKVLLEWALDYFGPNAGYAELYLFHGRRLKKSHEGE
jgi:N-glycosylase/DNA lyase